jgi:hypothetical protein
MRAVLRRVESNGFPKSCDCARRITARQTRGAIAKKCFSV